MTFKHLLAIAAVVAVTGQIVDSRAFADPTKAFDEMQTAPFPASAELIIDNNSAWYARWQAMAAATETIDASYFAVHNEVFGKAFLGMLLAKAEKGVKVRLVVDSKASMYFAGQGRDYLQELVANKNIQIRAYNPALRSLGRLFGGLHEFIASTHIKLLVVDGKIAFTGGRNISHDYYTDISDDPTAWRDSDVMLVGDEVGPHLKTVFETEFNAAHNGRVHKDIFGNLSSKRHELLWAAEAMNLWMTKGKLPPESLETRRYQIALAEWNSRQHEGYVAHEPVKAAAADMYNEELAKYKHMTALEGFLPAGLDMGDANAVVKVLNKQSCAVKAAENLITDNIIRLITNTEHELLIQNPYIIMSKKMRAALKDADARGVKITFHTNSPLSTDSLVTQAFFIDDWKHIVSDVPHAKIYLFVGQRKLHSKVFVFDRKVTIVGTYNLDNMSEQMNSEDVSVISSPILAERTAQAISRDLLESVDFTNPEDPKVPDELAKGKTKVIINILRKLGFLRPLA